MPELPEVETITKALEKCILEKRISGIILSGKNLRYQLEPERIDYVLGEKIVSIERRAKYMIWRLTNSWTILCHLGMSGNFSYSTKLVKDIPKHCHITIRFSDGSECFYIDPRRFGFICIQELGELEKFFSHLGLEPLSDEFNTQYFFEKTRNSKMAIKLLLMNNYTVVGVGNIYANESLFMAGIKPTRQANKLTKKDCGNLVSCIKEVLLKAIEMGGSSIRDFKSLDGTRGYFVTQFLVYQQKECSRCHHSLKELIQSSRKSYFCPKCQK